MDKSLMGNKDEDLPDMNAYGGQCPQCKNIRSRDQMRYVSGWGVQNLHSNSSNIHIVGRGYHDVGFVGGGCF